MSTVSVHWDPFAKALDDPYETYRELRDKAPVYYNEERDLWVLSRFADVHAANRAWKVFTYGAGVDIDDVGEYLNPGNFLIADPPDHTRLRSVVKDEFRIGSLRTRFSPIVSDAVKSLLSGRTDEADVIDVGEFAWQLPIVVGAELLGFPMSDIEQLRDAADAAFIAKTLEPAGAAASVEAAKQLRAYFLEQVQFRERVPQDDLLTRIVERLPGEQDQAAGVAGVIFGGSVDTTAMALTNALYLFGMDPAQRRVAMSSPEALERAIEEVLRYEAPIQAFKRTTAEAVELHGQTIRAGATVVLLYGSANRDERRFANADTFDVTRSGQRHLAFGDGIHHCIGAPLARLELSVALRELVGRIPNYTLGSGHVRMAPAIARGFQRLCLVPGA